MIDNFECQECGSLNMVNTDGFFVCQECGLTADDPVIQCDTGIFKTDKKGNSIQAHAILLKCTQLGNKSERRFRKKNVDFSRLNKINHSVSVDEKDAARSIFRRICSQFDINPNIEPFMKMFNKVFPEIRKRSKPRNLNLFCTTIFYVVMNNELKYITIKKLLENSDLTINEFYVCLKAISVEIPDLFKRKAEKIGVLVKQHISKIADDLTLSAEVRRASVKVSECLSAKLGYKSRIIAASSVTIAIRILSLENTVSVLQISECLEITASTVYSHLKSVNIDILKRKYQEYLDLMAHTTVSPKPIHIISIKLNPEIIIEGPVPVKAFKVPLPVTMVKTRSKKPMRRTSDFITKNKNIFSKFVPNPMLLENFHISNKLKKIFTFTEFDFSPPDMRLLGDNFLISSCKNL